MDIAYGRVKSQDPGNRSCSPLKVADLEWRPYDQVRAGTPLGVAMQGAERRVRTGAKHRAHLPAVRDFSAGVLSMETAVRRPRRGRSVGSFDAASSIADGSPTGRRQQSAVSPPALPFRTWP